MTMKSLRYHKLPAGDPSNVKSRKPNPNPYPPKPLRCCIAIGFIILFCATSLSAQENSSDGNSPLESNDFVISAGGRSPYAGFASTWGATLAGEFIFADVDLGFPIEMAVGAGAVGDISWVGESIIWSAGAYASAHVFPARSFGIYLQLGAAYAQAQVLGYSGGGIAFLGAAGIEIFFTDSIALFVESRLGSLGAGLRAKL